jgi:Family of unknown function (DUF5989)
MTQQAYDFERQIGTSRSNLAAEFWGFLKDNKKWWLLPIIVVFMFVGMLLVLGGTAAAPFIYTLF